MQKDWLEDLVVRETMKLIQDEAVIDKIVQLVMDVQNQENTMIPLLEKQLREVNKKLDNLMKAIEDGLYTRTTKERLEALESQKDELTVKIADEKLKKPSLNEDFIRFWLMKFRKFDISQKKQRKALIEIFVNAIFLYDDRMLITFNYKDGTQTVRFEDTLTADSAEEKSSDLSSSAGSVKIMNNQMDWDFFFRQLAAGMNIDETCFYFSDDPNEEEHYLGYLPQYDKPYWVGYCDIVGAILKLRRRWSMHQYLTGKVLRTAGAVL